MLRIAKIAAAFGFIAVASGAAQAMPASTPMTKGSLVVDEIAFRCGPGMERNRFGRCEFRRADRFQRPGPAYRRPTCPRGTHPASSGRRCVPNRF